MGRDRTASVEMRLSQAQAALRRLALLVAGGGDPDQVFAAVSEEAGCVLDAETTGIFRFNPDNTATVVGRWGANQDTVLPVGLVIPLDGDSVIIRVRATRAAARVETYDVLEGTTAEEVRGTGLVSSVAAPIVVEGEIWGALAVGTFEAVSFPDETEEQLTEFAELVSVAVAGAYAREQLLESRRRLVEAADRERSRLERNLHDGAQQRLVTLSIALRLARTQLERDPARAAELLDSAIADAAQAAEELREIARGLHPALLSERGLFPALCSLARRAPLPVSVDAPDERLPEPLEVAAYYVVAESLTNVAKHARASRAEVVVSRESDCVVVRITDDGIGGVDALSATGTGLTGLLDRIEALRGRLDIVSPPGLGTTLLAELPL